MKKQLWDVFISHASEDKEKIARPLAEMLQCAGLKVWYDEFSLELGDNLRQAIERGISESKYGVVILSPHFFEKGWTQMELEGLTAREIHSGKVILPVWHNLRYEDVLRHFPSLANKLAVTTDKGLNVVVQQICSLFEKETEEKQFKAEHPSEKILRIPVTHLQSEPLTVSKEEAPEVFGVVKVRDSMLNQEHGWRPHKYIENELEDQGETLVDHVTELVWQKSVSDDKLIYEDAKKYIEDLNRQEFAGHDDWRLPTIPELMSLLESKKQSNWRFISPMFDATTWECYWSADKDSSGRVWYIDFYNGDVYWCREFYPSLSVRVVRSWHRNNKNYRKDDKKVEIKKPSQQQRALLIHLRSEPWGEIPFPSHETDPIWGPQKAFGLDKNSRPREYVQNNFEVQNDVVIDHATGLMWQRSGSDEPWGYEGVHIYIDKLNHERFAGYDDWRLPTMEELMSLLEPKEQENGQYISPIFDVYRVPKYMSSDPVGGGGWYVDFSNGCVPWWGVIDSGPVRAVRAWNF